MSEVVLPYSEEAIRKLYAKLRVNHLTPILNEHHCLEYTGKLTDKGYGRLTMARRKEVYAHRAMMAVHNRRHLTEDELVMHLCDNPKCAEPAHLKIGTIVENNADRSLKGRTIGGRKGRKITPPVVAAHIKMLTSMDVGTSRIIDQIYDRFNVTVSAKVVRTIRSNYRWRSIPLVPHTICRDRVLVDEFSVA